MQSILNVNEIIKQLRREISEDDRQSSSIEIIMRDESKQEKYTIEIIMKDKTIKPLRRKISEDEPKQTAIEEADPFAKHKNILRGFVKKVLIDNELLQNKEYIFPFSDIMSELRERKIYVNDNREIGRFKQSLIGYKFNFTYEQEKYKINVVDVGRMYCEGNRTTCVKIQIIYIGI